MPHNEINSLPINCITYKRYIRMIILIITAITMLYFGFHYKRMEKSAKIKKYAADLIDSLFITSDNVILCKQTQSIESMKTKVKAYQSFIVIYKSDEKWRIERDRKKKIHLIDSYNGSNLILWEGNAKVKGIALDNAEEVLVLN